MKDISLYDILGVLAPGTVLTVGVVVLFPETAVIINNKDFSIGDLGLVVLVSYVMGNLVAAFGNVLEHLYWKVRGGWPTERARHAKHNILQSRTREALEVRMRHVGFVGPSEAIANLGERDWRQLARRIYTFIEHRGLTRRIDVFNAQYGMNRGIAAGFLALIVLVFVQRGWEVWRVALMLAGFCALALYRMNRFANYYATELFNQFIGAPDEAKPGEGTTGPTG